MYKKIKEKNKYDYHIQAFYTFLPSALDNYYINSG